MNTQQPHWTWKCAEDIYRRRAQRFLSGTDVKTRPLDAFEMLEVAEMAEMIQQHEARHLVEAHR